MLNTENEDVNIHNIGRRQKAERGDALNKYGQRDEEKRMKKMQEEGIRKEKYKEKSLCKCM